MALSEYNISKLSDSFIAVFLDACIGANKIPFLDICLALTYASKKIMKCLVEFDMITDEQLSAIENALSSAAEESLKSEGTQKLVKILKDISGGTDVGDSEE